MKGKLKKMQGITLIALVVTIVVLLILAATSISMLTGDNGIMSQAKRAKKENVKGEIKEELELEIADMKTNKISKGEELTQQEVIDRVNEIGGLVIDSTGDMIQGEYRDYEFIIDKNYSVTIGGELTGIKPTAEMTILDTDQGITSTRIQIVATTTEGEIQSIEALNGANIDTTNNEANKIFIVTKNGKYSFKITGTNGRVLIKSIEITNIIETIEAESLLEGISKATSSGIKEVKVNVESSGSTTEVKYLVNVIVSKEDLIFDGENEVAGVIPKNKVYQFGSLNDIATASANAKNAVALKVDGNLTIDVDVTLTAVSNSYGGPKGMIVYCTGTLNNGGNISMSGKGAKATGQNVYMWKNENNSYEFIPSTGASGGAAVTSVSSGSAKSRKCRFSS